MAADPEAEARRVRTRALVRHARAVDAILEAQEMGAKASPEQVKKLQEARRVFEDVRPYGSHDAEAAYKKNPELAREAAHSDGLDQFNEIMGVIRAPAQPGGARPPSGGKGAT